MAKISGGSGSGNAGALSVNFGDMSTYATKFANSAVDLENTLTSISSDLTQLNGGWKGQGAGAFTDLMVEWNKDADDIRQVLAEIATRLQKAGDKYSELDQLIKQGFSPTA